MSIFKNDKVSNSTENIDIYHLVSITPAGKILELARKAEKAENGEEALFYMGLFNLKAKMKWDEIINE